MRLSNFNFLVKKGISSIWYNRMMSFASFCVLMVSLLLVGILILVAANINLMLEYAEDQNEVLVFVEGEHDKAEMFNLLTRDYVLDIVFYPKDEAWDEWKNNTPEADSVYDYMEDNPMPDTYIVTFRDLTKISTAVNEFKQIESVYKVSAPHDYAEFLISMRSTLTIIFAAVISALIVVCLIIIYNSSRSSVFARRHEINIMKYVGATNAFVKIPFFIEGAFIGILSGIASWGLTWVSYDSITSVFSSQTTLWTALGLSELIPFDDISFIVLLTNCIAGAILSSIGTIMSMGKHLKV